MYRTLAIALILLTQVSLQGQNVEELIEMAKAYNPSIKAITLDYAAASEIVDQTGFFPDPKFNVGLGVLPVETRLGAQRIKLGITQAIPWKGVLDAEKALAQAKADIYVHQGAVKAIDIEYAIRNAYSTLIVLQQKNELLDRRFEILDVLETLAKSSVRSGKGKLSNVLLIQRNREFLEEERSILLKQLEQPTIAINKWTGQALDTKINTSEIGSPVIDPSRYSSYVETEHPQLKVLDSKVQALNSSNELTFLKQKPKIGVGLDYAIIDDRNDVNIPRNGRDILMPMASLSIPLNTDRYEAKRQENSIRQNAISERANALKDMYKAEIAQAFSKMELAQLSINKSERLKLITHETIKLMRTEYASEGSRFEELLRLEMELIDYDQMIIQAQYQKKLAEAVLFKYQ